MKEREFQLNINGLTPLVFNNPDSMMISKETDKGRDVAEWEQEHWMEKTYGDGNGILWMPSKWIKKALLRGCAFVYLKPPGRSKSFAPIIQACVMVQSNATLEYEKKQLFCWKTVCKMKTGASVIRYRPCLALPWSAGVKLSVFEDSLKLAALAEIAEKAGRFCGFGDARGIGYGRAKIDVTEI